MGVTVKCQLACHACGKRLISGSTLGREVTDNPCTLIVSRHGGKFLGLGSKKVIELGDKFLNRGDKLDKTLGDENHTLVETLVGTCNDRVGNIIHHLIEGHILGLDLLGNDTDVRLALESTFEGDM